MGLTDLHPPGCTPTGKRRLHKPRAGVIRTAGMLWAVIWSGGEVRAQENQAAGIVTRAHLVADLSVEPAQVEVSYTVRGVPESRILGVQVLPAGGVEVLEVQVEIGGNNRGVVGLASSPTGLLRSGVALGPRAEDEVDLEMTLRYELPAADSGWVERVVPIAIVGTAADEPRPGFFTAEITLPAGKRVREAFPVTYELAPDSTGTVFSTSMKIVPSFVRIRTGTGLRPLVLAEAAVMGILLLFGVVGWRWFTRRAFE